MPEHASHEDPVGPLPEIIVALRCATELESPGQWEVALRALAQRNSPLLVISLGPSLAIERHWAEDVIEIPGGPKALDLVRETLRVEAALAVVIPDGDRVAAQIADEGRLLALEAQDELDAPPPVGSITGKIASAATPLKLAFMGTRGVPSRYSGFETFVEQLGARLAAKGDEIIVYNRQPSEGKAKKTHRGMRLVTLFAPKSKHLETLVHTCLSMIHALFVTRPEVVIVCGVGNAPFFWIPRLWGASVICNVDGSDWKRDKWGAFARNYLRFCEKLAALFSDVLISDAKAVRAHYLSEFGRASRYIAYGGDLPAAEGHETLEEFGLTPGGYILFVGRLVPENCAHRLIEAYRDIETDIPLVIVGDATYAEEYKAQLRKMADDRVIFTGYQFESSYHQLSTHAQIYVLASNVGGTHPVLVEQMAYGNAVLACDTAANIEVLADSGVIYSDAQSPTSLRNALTDLLLNDERRVKLGAKARHRALRQYSWTNVTRSYRGLAQLLRLKKRLDTRQTRAANRKSALVR